VAYLSDGQLALFDAMSPSEQRHARTTWNILRQAGQTDVRLAQAALLHDIGKTACSVHLWHRVAKVLLEAIRPQSLLWFAESAPGTWRYPLYVLTHHAELGARAAESVGTDPLVVALIRWHHSPGLPEGLNSDGRHLLSLVRYADELS